MRLLTCFFSALLATGCAASSLIAERDEAPQSPVAAAKVGSDELSLGAAGAPATAPAAPPAATDAGSVAKNRQLIYNAGLRMVVPDIAAAQQTIRQRAESAGGYLQELDGPAIVVRVPAAKFQPTLDAIVLLGEVQATHVKVNDVTDEMRDLNIRLESAEAMRKRVTELLANAGKVEDALKMEEELERVTETIESLKGKLQHMQDQIAFSVIRVDLNSPRPQDQGGLAFGLPFPWVKELGDGAVSGEAQSTPDTDRFWKRNERFRLPPGFVRYYERDGITEAMSADGVTIKLRREDNFAGGDLSFWAKLARRVIVEERAIAVGQESDDKVKDGSAARLLEGVKDTGSRKQGYVLGIVATSRYVYTFEAWGDAGKVEEQKTALRGAFETLDVKHW